MGKGTKISLFVGVFTAQENQRFSGILLVVPKPLLGRNLAQHALLIPSHVHDGFSKNQGGADLARSHVRCSGIAAVQSMPRFKICKCNTGLCTNGLTGFKITIVTGLRRWSSKRFMVGRRLTTEDSKMNDSQTPMMDIQICRISPQQPSSPPASSRLLHQHSCRRSRNTFPLTTWA